VQQRDTRLNRAAVAVAERVATLLESYIHRGVQEVDIHDSIKQVLTLGKVRFEHEYQLSGRDRPDFFVEGLVVIEVKRNAAKDDVILQLGRYAEHPRVRALIIATPKSTSLIGMPPAIFGKPLYQAALPGPGLTL
jgi:hypothetical protein